VTIDASFILKILPVVKVIQLTPGPSPFQEREVVADQTPPEAGRKDVSRGDGVIRDPEIHRQVLIRVGVCTKGNFGWSGWSAHLLGPKGNVIPGLADL
jgi:hypothetical protein